MKRYRPPYSIIKWLQIRFLDLHIEKQNVIASRRVRSKDVALMANSVVGGSFDVRCYSGGSQVNRYPESYYDAPSNRAVEISETGNDFRQLNNSNQWSGRANYVQNVGHFQHNANQGSHYTVNNNTHTQYINYGNVERTGAENLHHSSGRYPAASQQYIPPVNSKAEPCQQYPTNLSNGYDHLSPQQTNYNPSVSHDRAMPSQQQLSAATGPSYKSEVEDDNDIRGTLEELDDFLKQWDLENAVNSMKKLSSWGSNIDLPRYLTLIEACGEAKALEEAKAVHEQLVKCLSPVNISTYNRMLEMYGKCDSMEDANNLFNEMPERNLTSWDHMITWYARNGLGEDAIDMFTKFKVSGLKPDGQLFLAIFEACGVVGDVSEGMLHFDAMIKNYGISPTMAHYAGIVHMFGSAGDLDGALEFIEKMPVEPSADVWESLMNVSRIQGNVELGDHCAQIVDQLDPSRLTEEARNGLLQAKGPDSLKKKVKKARLLENRQHEYRAGDRSHPETVKIYALLRGIKESMKEAGYVAETRFVLHDIDPEGKEEAIMAHSERLAFASALMTSKPRSSVRIMKNLRVCGDCHNVFKIFSKLVGREIVMRDAKRFHHFRDGVCSCNDYW